MIIFWIFAIAMVIVALIVLIRPLRHATNEKNEEKDIDRSEQNVKIAKERLKELESDLEQAIISQQEYDQTRQELEQSLLNDIQEQPASEKLSQLNDSAFNKRTHIALIILVPALALSFYFYLGQPGLIDGIQKQTSMPAGHASSTSNGKLASVEKMVEQLAAKLKENPNNPEGWFMLGRSYMSMKKFNEAVAALEITNQLVPNNPAVMLRYADALTMLRGGQISGKPFELIKKAVEIKPDDTTGLWLLGLGYEEKGEYQKAISYWNLLIPLLKDQKSISEVQSLISRAKGKSDTDIVENVANIKPKQSNSVGTSILSIKVSLAQSIKEKISGNDTVFVFARAVNGPPMPLAVVRKQVKDLPLTIKLDDSMAMMPSLKISNFAKVQVVARISKSGNAKAQSGDFQSEKQIVNTNNKDHINLSIQKVLP